MAARGLGQTKAANAGYERQTLTHPDGSRVDRWCADNECSAWSDPGRLDDPAREPGRRDDHSSVR